MVRTILIMSALCVFPIGLSADEQAQQKKQSVSDDRGYIQMDACFGDRYETDDDLMTGNELAVQKALELLLNPGT